MTIGGKSKHGSVALLALAAGLFMAACGDDNDDEAGSDDGGGAEEAAPTQNACPADGCQISFASLAESGDEIEATWDINFSPDVANNHIHIYWDNFTAAQVSNDAADRGVEQGEWVPTDESPSYVTDGPASTSVRGDSTTLCVVAADRDHNVIDVDTEVCQDVSDYL